jgi:MFS family permease
VTDVDQPTLQRRVVTTLMASQVLGGVALTAGIAVMALLAEKLSGSTSLAGLASSAQVLGGALIAIPVARLTAARGRRRGLLLGYGLSALGAVGVILAGTIGSFGLLLVSAAVFGGATTSNSQARYAAADLAAPAHRGRDLSLVVWATTIGSVVGPNLAGPGAALAKIVGIPALTGTFVISIVALGGALAVLHFLLRPDPLLVARARQDPGHVAHGSVWLGLRVILARPGARAGLLTLTLGHAVMVSVMVVTPLHMSHGGAALTEIGLVISLHIVGMFAFSPLTGMAVDRFGAPTVALVGGLTLSAATLLTSIAPQGHSLAVILGLFFLGLGWSCTLVSGSTMLVASVPVADRPASQGAADLVMGLVAAAGGGLAAYVIAVASYHVLSLGALALAVVIGLGAVLNLTRPAPH